MNRLLRMVLLGLAFWVAAACAGKDGKLAPARDSASKVELKGVVVHPTATLPTIIFKTMSGPEYTIVRTRLSEALFVDTNFLNRVLLLNGRVDQNARTFEITGKWRSIRDGKVYDLSYYCDVCAITQIEPGPCMCCREPVKLIEEPAK